MGLGCCDDVIRDNEDEMTRGGWERMLWWGVRGLVHGGKEEG